MKKIAVTAASTAVRGTAIPCKLRSDAHDLVVKHHDSGYCANKFQERDSTLKVRLHPSTGVELSREKAGGYRSTASTGPINTQTGKIRQPDHKISKAEPTGFTTPLIIETASQDTSRE